MAITIQQSPGTKQPAYNDLTFVVSSDNSAQQNFRFVADVYISGVSGYYRLKKAPDPTYSVGVFDVHRIIENYLTHDIAEDSYGFQRNDNSWRQYQVKFGEEYGISSGIVVYPNLTLSSSGDVINAALGFTEYKDYAQANYILSDSNKKFLTNAPSSQNINSSEHAWLHMLQETSGVVSSARIRTYNSAGSLIEQFNIVNPYPDSDAEHRNQFLRFGCGTTNLNQIDESLLNGSVQPIIADNVASYDITIRSSPTGGANRSETRTYVITNNCSRFTTYRLHFLNKLGGFDSFTFSMRPQEQIDVSRNYYKKDVRATTATTSTYNKKDRENVEIAVNYQDSLVLESDWITEDEATWLEELIHSPVVYHYHATHKLMGINITTVRFQRKFFNTDKLINIIIEAKYSHNNSRQRG